MTSLTLSLINLSRPNISLFIRTLCNTLLLLLHIITSITVSVLEPKHVEASLFVQLSACSGDLLGCDFALDLRPCCCSTPLPATNNFYQFVDSTIS